MVIGAILSVFLRLFLCLCGAFSASTHDTDFVAVLVYILSIFYLVAILAFYPAEAWYIDHILRAAIGDLQLRD